MGYLIAQPSFIDFGTNYRNAHLAGSFQIFGARKFKKLVCFSEYLGVNSTGNSPPRWLRLSKPSTIGPNQIAWNFRIDTTEAGFRDASLSLEFDAGRVHVDIRAAIKAERSALGDLVICDKPFDLTADFHSTQDFARFMKGLDFRVHHLDSIPPRFSTPPRTILLHGVGLIHAAHESLPRIMKLAKAGTNIVVLADKFFRGTAEAADKIGAQYGMSMHPGAEGSYRSGEELVRDNERLSESAQIRRHPLTKGVNRIFWHRPWPIDCMAKGVARLITDSADPTKCYAAAAKPNGYIVLVGKSVLHSFVSVGWPFDNDRLLANILVGGDAECI